MAANAQQLADFLRGNISALVAVIVDSNPNEVKLRLAQKGIAYGDGSNTAVMQAVASLLSEGDKKTAQYVLAVPYKMGVLPPEYDTAVGMLYQQLTPKAMKKIQTREGETNGTGNGGSWDWIADINFGGILCAIMGNCPDVNNNTNIQQPPAWYETTGGAVVIGGLVLVVLLVLYLLLK